MKKLTLITSALLLSIGLGCGNCYASDQTGVMAIYTETEWGTYSLAYGGWIGSDTYNSITFYVDELKNNADMIKLLENGIEKAKAELGEEKFNEKTLEDVEISINDNLDKTAIDEMNLKSLKESGKYQNLKKITLSMPEKEGHKISYVDIDLG